MKLIEFITRIHVRLLDKKTQQPLTGESYRVAFFDRDVITDDPLGAASPDENGIAMVPIVQSDYRTTDSPWEKFPDIFFIVEKNGKEIYKSPVYKNLHLKEVGEYDEKGALYCDLGTFLME